MNNNVLWKRLYYGLFIITIGLIGCFCNAGFEYETLSSGNITTIPNQSSFLTLYDLGTEYLNFGDIFCFSGTVNQGGGTSLSSSNEFRFGVYNGAGINSSNTFSQLLFGTTDNGTHRVNKIFGCVSIWRKYQTKIGINSTSTSSLNNISIDYEILQLTNNGGGQQQCDYTDYELKSDITENYCKNKFNNLIDENDCNCENEGENECTGGSENGTGEINWSSIYINNIQHNGAGLINITIPEEIERDYTNENDEIDVDVIGYGYDQEKMQSMVNTQYYTPTPEDMNKLIGKIADFLPLMAIVLLVCYAWRLIKKVF